MNPASQSAESPQQATPPCPHFGVCGGCQLQHLSYSAQLDRKAQRVRELLGNFTLPDLQLHPSPPLAYRNRIRLTLRDVEGRLRAGYLGTADTDTVIPAQGALNENGEVEALPPFDSGAPFIERAGMSAKEGSSQYPNFVPITQCPIAAPLLWCAAEAFLSLANDAAWLRGSSLTPDQLELFTTADESKLQLTLFLRTSAKSPPARLSSDFTSLCESLRVQLPQLAGAGIALLPPAARSRQSAQPRPGPLWGSPGISYSLESRTSNPDPLSYWVPRGAFFQVNRFLLPELVALIANAAQATPNSSLAWDLYAGVGLFSRALARTFSQVTGVEIAEPAATALAQTNLPNLRAVKATTLDFLRAHVVQRERPSLIILDPPRTGAGPEVCHLLTRVAAPTLIYVSCSPNALARDLALLTASGYSLAELHLFDLFPQTGHVETVAVLTRS